MKQDFIFESRNFNIFLSTLLTYDYLPDNNFLQSETLNFELQMVSCWKKTVVAAHDEQLLSNQYVYRMHAK